MKTHRQRTRKSADEKFQEFSVGISEFISHFMSISLHRRWNSFESRFKGAEVRLPCESRQTSGPLAELLLTSIAQLVEGHIL